MSHFTPIPALAGGALIGLSASLLMLSHGRVAGVSGILGRIVAPPPAAENPRWRWVFLIGMLLGGALLLLVHPTSFAPSPRSLPVVMLSGLLVGVGTRLGNGCTSGHGVCGLSRFSPRSLVATMAFMATGMLTAGLFRAWIGA